MRVRINYGVELEQVPMEACRIGNSALRKATYLIERQLRPTLEQLTEKNADLNLITEKLDEIRKELANIDATIADVQSIVVGLNAYYNGEQDVSERRFSVDTPGGSPASKESTE